MRRNLVVLAAVMLGLVGVTLGTDVALDASCRSWAVETCEHGVVDVDTSGLMTCRVECGDPEDPRGGWTNPPDFHIVHRRQ